jgi:hypothetical protein
LRRNGLLSPRYPTQIEELSATVEDVVEATDAKGVDLFGVSNILFKIRCTAKCSLLATQEELEGDATFNAEDGSLGKIFREEWVVHRTLKEFQSLHKHLKMQVSVSESSGTAGSRLVGAAAAAFAATTAMHGRHRKREALLPSLSHASKTGALGVTKKLLQKRKEILDGYLAYLLSPTHLLSRSAELLLFLGAFYPLDPAVRVGVSVSDVSDPLGRTEMSRTVLQTFRETQSAEPTAETSLPLTSRTSRARSATVDSIASSDAADDEFFETSEDYDMQRKSLRKIDIVPAIRSKIDKVTLSQVRNRVFELLRYQFGFENASFIRNRMLAALKTASFAVTSGAELRRTLYRLHVEHLNADGIAGWIKFLIDLLWPDGMMFESSPSPSPEELEEQAKKSKELLHASFPDQVRAVLGQELTRDGMEIFHEMLQNRLVVKSMAYMLFDVLWQEVFPELGDVLPCGAALEMDK